MAKPRVLIACCNGSGNIHKTVAFSVMGMLQDSRTGSRFIAPTHSPFVQNLHRTVKDFLRGGEDYLLLVDDDNPPQRNALDLAFLDLDVVGLPTPVWHSEVKGDRPYYYNALTRTDLPDGTSGFRPLDAQEGFSPRGLYEADAVGTGCVMIARRVLVELMDRCKGDPTDTPFMRLWTDEGLVERGNDYAFCTRAKAAGFRVWAHFDYTCDHFVTLPLREVIEAFGTFFEQVRARG